MKSLQVFSLSLLACSSLVACGGEAGEDDDSLATTEQHDTIEPKGKAAFGKVVVVAPTFAGKPAAEKIDISGYSISVGSNSTTGGSLQFGTPVDARVGKANLSIDSIAPTFTAVRKDGGTTQTTRMRKTSSVTVVSKQTVSVTAPLAAVHADLAAKDASVTAGRRFGEAPEIPDVELRYRLDPSDPLEYLLPFGKTVVVPSGGELFYGYEGDLKSVNVAAGTYSNLTLPPLPKLPGVVTLDIAAPERELPNLVAQAGRLSCQSGNYYPDVTKASATFHGYVSPINTECKLMFEQPRNDVKAPLLQTKISIPLTAGAKQTISIKRIDVKDVEITPENGKAPYIVKGSWDVYDETSSQLIVADLPTGYGVDVLPGKYRVEVSHRGDEGKTEVETFHLDFTK